MNPMEYIQESGMTLRDYFAAKAMQGCVSNPLKYKDATIQKHGSVENAVAFHAYALADAMLEARKKGVE